MTTLTNQGIREVFMDLSAKLDSSAEKLNTAIGEALDGDEVDPMKMLQLQFNMGRYNAMVEATSSVVKGLTDTAKTLAQRSGG